MSTSRVIMLLIVGAMLGNCEGDYATLRECAVKGEATMVGGGKIKCGIVKELKK